MPAAEEGGEAAPEKTLNGRGRPRLAWHPGVIAVIAAGGALGASARYAIEHAMARAPLAFPWATLTINAAGSFLLGSFVVISVERLAPHRYLRPFVATGLLGGFTTFSTFAVEEILLVDGGHITTAVAYLGASLAGGLAAAWAGGGAARRLPQHWRHAGAVR